MTEAWARNPVIRISRDEQWGIAALQYAARAASRGSIEYVAASEDEFSAEVGV